MADPSCAPCHRDQVERHRATNHAQAMRRAAGSAFATSLPGRPIAESRAGFQLSYTVEGNSIAVEAVRGPEMESGRIDWVLGAGDQGITPLVRLNGRWLEHRFSFYPQARRFDLTLGHQPGNSKSARAALGIEQPESTIRSCLHCHSSIAATTLAILAPGVTCVRCHAGAEAHARTQAAVANPRKLSPKAQVELCAECHRLTPPGRAADPLNIRFQPLRLAMSPCYSKGGASCLTCHAAHENAVRADTAYYRSRCQSCHASQHAKQSSNCLSCHMPKSSPAPYLQFTDHFIRK